MRKTEKEREKNKQTKNAAPHVVSKRRALAIGRFLCWRFPDFLHKTMKNPNRIKFICVH